MASVDITETHIKTKHVVAIIAAIVSTGVSVGAYVGKAWIENSYKVTELEAKLHDVPLKNKSDLTELKNDLSVDQTHTISARVKFYMEKAALICEPPAHGQHKLTCKLVWPPPSDD